MNRLILLILAMAATGCSAPVERGKGYASTDAEIVDPSRARLVIYTQDPLGRSTYYKIRVDGRTVGDLGTDTFMVHTVMPGTVTVSAKRQDVEAQTMYAVFGVLSMGAMWIDTKDSVSRMHSVESEVPLSGGETVYLRPAIKSVQFLYECEKSRGEAELCRGQRRDLVLEMIPVDFAVRELRHLQESVK